MRKNQKIKIGLVSVTKNCDEEKKIKIKLKLFELITKFKGNFIFEFLAGEKKIEKQFEYLEKVFFQLNYFS